MVLNQTRGWRSAGAAGGQDEPRAPGRESRAWTRRRGRVPSAGPRSAGWGRGPYLAEGGAEHGAQPVEERVRLGGGGRSRVPAPPRSQGAPQAERRGQSPFLPIPPAGPRQRRRRRRSGRRSRRRLPGPAVRLGQPTPAPPRALVARHRAAQGPPRTGVPGRRRRARAGAGQPAARQPGLAGRAVAGSPAAPARRRRLQQRRLGLALGDVRAHRGGTGARMARRGRRGAPGGQRAGCPAGAEPEDALEAGAVPRPLKCGPVAAAHVTAQPVRPETRAPGGWRCGSRGAACGPPRAHPRLSRSPGTAAPRPFPRPALGESRFRAAPGGEGDAAARRREREGRGLADLPQRDGHPGRAGRAP